MTVGVFVVIAVCALVWLIYKFGDLPLFVSPWKSFELRVQFPLAPGIQENTPVRFCGFQVGRVIKVEPPKILKNPKTGRWAYQTMVIIDINREYENVIPEDVEVKLMTRGFGSSYIEFDAKPFDVQKPQGPFLAAGGVLQGSTGTTSEFFPEESQKKLDQLASDIQNLVNNANDILGDRENKKNIKATFANLTKVTEEVQKALKEFKNFSVAGTQTLKNTDTKLEKVTLAMIDTSEELSDTLAQLRTILEKINSGEGSAGKLLNDGRFYEGLLDSNDQLQALLTEMKEFIAQSKQNGLPIKVK